MVDHHVDRPEVEREQSPQLTGTNRSIGLLTGAGQPQRRTTARVQRQAPGSRRGRPTRPADTSPSPHILRELCRPGGHSEGPNTRSHPELGRENPQRPWYCRTQRRKSRSPPGPPNPQLSLAPSRPQRAEIRTVAGWSSPVARQAHNLKVVGSNPTPATKSLRSYNKLTPAPEA